MRLILSCREKIGEIFPQSSLSNTKLKKEKSIPSYFQKAFSSSPLLCQVALNEVTIWENHASRLVCRGFDGVRFSLICATCQMLYFATISLGYKNGRAIPSVEDQNCYVVSPDHSQKWLPYRRQQPIMQLQSDDNLTRSPNQPSLCLLGLVLS